LKPDGGLYEILASTGYNINQSVFINKLDAAYWTNPALLHDAPVPTTAAPSLTTSFSSLGGNQFSLSAGGWGGFVGKMQATLTASDGANLTSQVFFVTVTNQAPVVGTVNDLSVSYTAGAASVTFSASDVDSMLTAPASFSVSFKTLAQVAYALDTQLSLIRPSSPTYSYNARGQQEKYIASASGRWFYLKPDGGFYEILASTGY